MIYVLITTSLIDKNFNNRKQQYLLGISNTIMYFREVFKKNKIDYKFIIIENNNKIDSFLNDFKQYSDIFYTNNNNLINNPNKGIKEIIDIHDCIKHYNINDEDFIIKVTGRYILQENSEFIKIFNNYNENIHCIVRYGSFFNKDDYNINDCVTGLIGLKCKYVKNIEIPDTLTCIEHKWAKTIKNEVPILNIISLKKLGIYIIPEFGDNYHKYDI